jgi:hypothetical protein
MQVQINGNEGTSGAFMAQREYTLDGRHPPLKTVVRIGVPKQRSSDGRYECAAQIDDGETCRTKPMNGVDSLEALQLAMLLIGTELKAIIDSVGGSVSWLDGSRHDLGIRVYPDYSLNSVFGDEGGLG